MEVNVFKITLSELRNLVNDLIIETMYYDLPLDKVKREWPNEYADAVEFVACYFGISEPQARSYIASNWVFDTMEHEGKTVLLARDEDTRRALSYVEKMGGWWFRMGDNKPQCRQVGKTAGRSTTKPSRSDTPTRIVPKDGEEETLSRVTGYGPTGTRVSRYR